MGYLGDILGRNIAMILTLSTASLAGVCSATLPTGSPTLVYITIIICRFMLGAGLGGVYPLSAAKAAEDGAKKNFFQNVGTNRQKSCHENDDPCTSAIPLGESCNSTKEELVAGTVQSAMAFFWQIPGSMTPWALAYVFSYHSLPVDTMWRLLLGLGSIPAALVVALSIFEIKCNSRQSTVECTRQEVEVDLRRSSEPVEDVKLAAIFHKAFRSKEIWFKVFYTGGSWFLYDVCFCKYLHRRFCVWDFLSYFHPITPSISDFFFTNCADGVGLFGGQIVSSISPPRHDSVSSMASIRSTSLKQVFALSLGIPACAVTILLLKIVSTKRLQTLGFLFVSFSFTLLASVYDIFLEECPSILYCIYCLLLFSLSGGPMLTTFILPAETFPKEIRSTFGGIAAACGKLGAFVGAFSFGPLASSTSLPFVMAVCALLAVLGALLTHTCIGAEITDGAWDCSRENVLSPDAASTSDCTISLMHSQCSPACRDELAASSSTSNELDISHVTNACDNSNYDNMSTVDPEEHA